MAERALLKAIDDEQIPNASVLKKLITKPRQFDDKYVDVNLRGTNYDTVLILAIRYSNINVIKLLIEHGADVTITGYFDRTPLMVAALSDELEIMKLLLEKGSEVDAIDLMKQSALLLVANHFNDLPEVVQLLIDNKANVNIKDRYGKTPLIAASILCRLEIMKILIKNGAIIDDRDIIDNTALMNAMTEHKPMVYIDVVEILVDAGADINSIGGFGRSALYLATEQGHEAVVKLFMEKNASVDIVDGLYGGTPITLALKKAAHADSVDEWNRCAPLSLQRKKDIGDDNAKNIYKLLTIK